MTVEYGRDVWYATRYEIFVGFASLHHPDTFPALLVEVGLVPPVL